MTSVEILEKFYYRFRSMHDLDAHVFQTDEIEEFFNASMFEFLDRVIPEYEKSELVRIALEPLVITHECDEVMNPTYTIIDANSQVFLIPTDCYAVVLAQAEIHYNETIVPEQIDGVILVKPITHDQYWTNIKNPYKKPYRELAWRLNYIEGHEVIPDSTYTILDYIIRYVKKPTIMDVMENSTVELQEKEIDSIIDATIVKAMQSLINNNQAKLSSSGVMPSSVRNDNE